MTSRERVIATIHHQTPDRIPIDLGSTRTSGISAYTYNRLKSHLHIGSEVSKVVDVYQMLAYVEPEIVDRLHIDAIMAPKLSHRLGTQLSSFEPFTFPDGSRMLMPCGFAPSVLENGDLKVAETDGSYARLPKGGFYFDYVEGSIPEAPFNVDDIRFGDWPDEDFRFCEEHANRLYDETDKALVGDFGVSLGKPGSYEDWLLSLAANPAYIKEFNDKKSDHIVNLLGRYREAMRDRIQIIFFGQDFGTQNGEMIGPPMFDELFAPYFTKIFSWIHTHTDWKIFFHCCGSIYYLLPALIECGVDILNPVQAAAVRMNPSTLKEEFGDKLVFWGGGVDTQDMLPFGTQSDIRKQVFDRVATFGTSGFVFNPVHNIQAGISPENIVAAYDAAYDASCGAGQIR